MNRLKDSIVYLIQQDSKKKMVEHALAYMHAEPGQGQAHKAAIEIENWVLQTCRLCLD
jgi:hypothetical protein